MEQPNAFVGYDPEHKALFNTFNNFGPMDIFGTIVEDAAGDIDVHKTLIKSGLAQLAPWLKLPLEYMYGKSFFTDKAISPEDNPRAGRINSTTPKEFLGNL